VGLAGFSIAMAQAQPPAAIVGTGYGVPVPIFIAPGALTTIYVQGIGSGIVSPVFASGLPLPTKLRGISVSLRQFEDPHGPLPVPILAVFPVPACRTPIFPACGTLMGINVQIPFELVPVNAHVEVSNANYAQIIVQEDGGGKATVEAMPIFDRIHVVWTGDTLKNPAAAHIDYPIIDPSNASVPVVTHADGTLVGTTNPASVGETLIMYLTGLGWFLPLPKSGEASPNPPLIGQVTIGFDYRPDAKPSLPSAGTPHRAALTPGFVGLYQVNFVVPPLPAGYPWRCGIVNSNLTVSIGRKTSFDGAGICVQIPGTQQQ
jgi:uncharacterized protein (TIGR03437 family)